MKNLIRTTVVATALVAVSTLGPAPSEASTPLPSPTAGTGHHPDGWWCRLTHLC